MKKVLLSLTLASAFVFASCDSDGYFHQFSILSPVNNVGVVYADQLVDTVWLSTTDSYKVKSENSWMALAPGADEYKVKYIYGGVYQLPVPLCIEPNTTGANRKNYLSFSTEGEDGWTQSTNVQYTQVTWLNVINPLPRYVADSTSTFAKCEFLAIDSTQTREVLKFEVYGDWTLTDGSFVHPEKTSGYKGRNEVSLTIDTDKRCGDTLVSSITLTSNGISTPIVYKLLPKKKD